MKKTLKTTQEMTICSRRTSEASSKQKHIACIKSLDQPQIVIPVFRKFVKMLSISVLINIYLWALQFAQSWK